MVRKFVYSIIICFATIFLIGCGNEVKQTNKCLNIHIGTNFNRNVMEYAVEAFRKEYPDIPVKVTESVDDTLEDMNESQDKLLTDIMSGNGPDIFFLESSWDIDKLIEAGVLADLTEIYNQCDVFKDDEFIQPVMDQSLVDGKRYFIPYDFRMDILLTTQEILDKTGFDIEKCIDFSGFMEESLRYINSEQCDRRVFRLDLNAKNALFNAGYQLVEDRKMVWDIEETRDYFAWCKEMVAQGTDIYYFGDLYAAAAIRDGQCIFASLSDEVFNSGVQMTAIDTVGTPVLFPLYNLNGKITAVLKQMVGVRANSENMDNVKKFIEILFRKDIMNSPGAASESFSVRRTDVDEHYSEWCGQFGQSINDFPAVLPNPPKETLKQYFSYVDEIDSVVYWPGWRSDFLSTMDSFYEDGNYEEAAKKAKEKVEFYLSE